MYTIIDNSHFNLDNFPYDIPQVKLNTEENNTQNNDFYINWEEAIEKAYRLSDTNTVFDAMIGWDNEYNSYAIRLNSNKQPINFYSWYERY